MFLHRLCRLVSEILGKSSPLETIAKCFDSLGEPQSHSTPDISSEYQLKEVDNDDRRQILDFIIDCESLKCLDLV